MSAIRLPLHKCRLRSPPRRLFYQIAEYDVKETSIFGERPLTDGGPGNHSVPASTQAPNQWMARVPRWLRQLLMIFAS